MKVNILSISPPSKPGTFADVRVEVVLDEHHRLTINDLRILRNSQHEWWVGMPSRAVKSSSESSKLYTYMPIITLSTKLKRLVEDTVIDAYEQWAKRKIEGEQ